MTSPETGVDKGVSAFRARLLAGMLIVVVALTVGGREGTHTPRADGGADE